MDDIYIRLIYVWRGVIFKEQIFMAFGSTPVHSRSSSASPPTPGTQEELRAQVGEENASRIIANLGTLAQASGAQGGAIDQIVTQVLGRLSASERRAMAMSGAAPSNVVGWVQEAIKNSPENVARNTNIFSSAHIAAQAELGRLGERAMGLAGYGGTGGEGRPNSSRSYDALADATKYDASKGAGGLTAENFKNSPYAGAGLGVGDIPIIKSLAAQGFAPAAIKDAARLTNDLGISRKEHMADVAQLKRDVPNVEKGLRQTKSLAEQAIEAEKKAAQAKTEEERQRLQKIAEEARKRLEEHNRQERDRAEKAKPGSGEKLGKIQAATEQAIRGRGKQLKPEDEQKLRAAVSRAHENPKDAKAQQDLRTLKSDPKLKKAAAAAETDVTRQNKIAAKADAQKQQVDKKKGQIAAVNSANRRAALASLD
jgi:hypothetical protein